MISSTREDMCGLHANTRPFYRRALLERLHAMVSEGRSLNKFPKALQQCSSELLIFHNLTIYLFTSLGYS